MGAEEGVDIREEAPVAASGVCERELRGFRGKAMLKEYVAKFR